MRRQSLAAVSVLVVAWAPAALSTAADAAAKVEFFEKKIRPVLATHCYECHSAEAAKAGTLEGKLALDSRAGIRQGGESGPAVVPGDVAASVIIAALKHEGLEMPPDKRLPDDVVADFVAWVRDGAADPREDGAVVSTAIDIEKGRGFWSFTPPK
ncbi:MAG: c-type cytochrome domain-containing protein, partial [Planctomycetia bacterium]